MAGGKLDSMRALQSSSLRFEGIEAKLYKWDPISKKNKVWYEKIPHELNWNLIPKFDSRLVLEFEATNGRRVQDLTLYGFGHGLGMSQWGSKYYAQDGMSYKAILRHYYSGTEVQRLPCQ